MKSKLLAVLVFCLILGSCSEKEGPVITIYHTNDIQGFYWPRPNSENENKLTGGFAVLKNMLSKEEDYLLFDSGDSFSETQEGQLNKLEGAINLFNKLHYTAITLSASDLVFGWDIVEPAIAKAKFPVVVSNLSYKEGGTPAHIKRYIMLDYNKTKIAVLGLISKADFPDIQRNSNIVVEDEIKTLKDILPIVQDEGAQIIIILSSLGFEIESQKNRVDEQSLAEEFPEISLILGGNADISTDGIERISHTIITRGDSMFMEVDRLTLSLNKNKQISAYNHEPLMLTEQLYGQDAEIKEIVDGISESVKKRTSYKVASVLETLDSYPDKLSPMGVFTAECIKQWGRNEIGLVNSDAFLSSLPQGAVTDVSLSGIIPFPDRVMFLKMRGDELKNALEQTLEFKNNFPQTAGLKVFYDPKAPLGKKIKKMYINGEAVQNARVYSISSTDHIVAGGFGHNEFINVFEFKNTDRTLRDITRWCLSRQRNINAPKADAWEISK